MLFDETRLVHERVNLQYVAGATLLEAAIAAQFSKKAYKRFEKVVKEMLEEDDG